MNQRTAKLIRRTTTANGEPEHYRISKRQWNRTPRNRRAYWRGMFKVVCGEAK